MENSDNKLIDGIGGIFTSKDELNINGFQDYSGDEDLTDEQLDELKKQRVAPSVLDVFGADAIKKPSNSDDDITNIDEEDDEEEEVEEKKPKKQSKRKPKVVEEIEDEEDDNNLEEDDDTSKNNDSDSDDDDSDSEPDKETSAVSMFFDALNEQMGIEVDEEDEKPNTVEGLIDYFVDLIEENSVPTYANEQVKELDEFVRNGGKLSDYFTKIVSIDYDNFDITSESNQKRIVEELLIEKGFNQKQIERKIAKYESAGLLEDEAEDALESLKEIREAQKEELLETQKIAREDAIKRQQNFVEDVVSNIKQLDSVRGINVPKKDKEALLTYIFKKDATGKSQYEKDFAKDNVKNLIESAYYLMRGDELVSNAKKAGKSSAMKALKQSLSSTGSGKGSKRIKTNSNSTTFSHAIQQYFKQK